MPKVEIIISMRVNDLENELLNFNEKVFLMTDTECFRFIRIQYSFKMSHYIKVAYRSQRAHLGRFIKAGFTIKDYVIAFHCQIVATFEK